jgi:ADP-heptose:LPS heptosyltransferase
MHLLVFRFSAIGDVALTLPVLRGLLIINPELRITLVSNEMFRSYFRNIDRLTLFPVDFKNKYQGFRGLVRLYRELSKIDNYDYVIDLHGVLRSYVLGILFRLKGKHVFGIDKGRKEKSDLIKGNIFHPLKHTTERYLDVFRHLPLKTWIPYDSYFSFDPASILNLMNRYPKKTGEIWVGIAPFSKHPLKNWPLENMKSLMRNMGKKSRVRYFIFGGGSRELAEIDRLIEEFPGALNAAKELNFNDELDLITQLDLMISMDSANMHIASFSGVKTVTLWGATHPYAGFSAYHSNNALDIQISKEQLNCRPCSVFGKGTCRRKDFACMNWLTPEKVYQEIRKAGYF